MEHTANEQNHCVMNILVVEDSNSVRAKVSDMLRENGHTVYEADNGKSALARFEDSTIDLVITDILMPEMDGLELISELSLRTPELPVIAVSGSNNATYLQIAEKMGAIGTLAKPFTMEQLSKYVQKLVLQ